MSERTEARSKSSSGPLDFGGGDFHCGRCGTLLDGNTDEPVSAREMRGALERAETELAKIKAEAGRTEPGVILQAWADDIAERDRYRAALIQCATEAGEDVSDGPPTWPTVDVWAVEAVKQLRQDYIEAGGG